MTGGQSLEARVAPARRSDGTVAMINIVFLLLLFFLIAGQIAAPLSREITLVETSDMPNSPPPGGIVLHADGRMSRNGTAVTLEAILAGHAPGETLRLVPDRALPAKDLVRIVKALRQGGATAIRLVTLRGTHNAAQ